MKQTQKLNALISKIIKEELDVAIHSNDRSQKGELDVTVPSKFAFAIADSSVTDDPSYVSFMKSKDGGETYNLKIPVKSDEFNELKKAMVKIKSRLKTPELKKAYDEVMAGIKKAGYEGVVYKEANKKFITPDGRTLTAAQKAEMAKGNPGDTFTIAQAGKVQENETQEPVMEQEPTGTDIAGQVAEIVEKLKIMSEGSEDPKKQKHAAKVMKYMESAKAALEALTAHETMLEEKQREDEEKEGQKHVDKFKKHLTKLVKDPVAVEKIASKLDAKKIADLKKKMNRPELDEEKLARVMLSRSLKEGWVKISKA
jgi:hypothetical protein